MDLDLPRVLLNDEEDTHTIAINKRAVTFISFVFCFNIFCLLND